MTIKLQCPDVQQLSALALGDMTDADARALRQHLEGCGECSALTEKLTNELSATDHAGPRDRYPTQQVRSDTESPADPPTPHLASGDPAPAATTPASVLSPPLGPDELGRLGPYRVLRLLGRGGMGVVYQAEDVALGRPVAIKIIKEELADQLDPWERFLREARTLASIKHEHVVSVYHTGREGKVGYLVMELLQGCSLADHLEKVRRPSLAEILRLGRELAAGLAVVHSHGLVHRDIKPANVWVEAPSGRVKILDFGLARMVHDDARLTQTGVVVGTPAYMSPEQARGVEVDQRSDLFSLGCILYRCCTGVEPFRGPDTMGMLMALAVDAPRPVEELNPEVPRALAGLVLHLLAKKPEDRPATAADVIARLEGIEQSPGQPVPPTQFSDVTPLAGAVRKLAPPEESRNGTALRFGLLLAGCVLAGVVGGAYTLLTPAAPNPPVKEQKEQTGAVVEASPTAPVEADKKVPQRPLPAVVIPREVPKPAEPKRTFTEYLSDWQPVSMIGWPPELPPSTAVKPPPSSSPPPPPPPPPRGPRDRPPRGGPFGPPPDGGPPAAPSGNGSNASAPAVEAPPSLTFPFLSVNGKLSPHGVGMHAVPKGKVGLSYALDGRFDTFVTEVSLNDTSARSPVSLTFSVYGDGERLWQSLPLLTRSQAQKCNVSVKGVSVLQLTVTNTAGDAQSVVGAHSLWVEPHVIGRK